jgi:hypothetical protein
MAQRNSQFNIFNQVKGLEDDKCYLQVTDLMDQSMNNYMLNNYFMGSCLSQDNKNTRKEEAIEQFAMDNGMTLFNGYGNTNVCDMEDDNKMRNGKQLTHDKQKRQLFQRIFHDVPALSRGGLIADVQSKIQIGDDTRVQRSCNVLSEVSTLDLQFTPMLDCVREIQNPKHIINEHFLGNSRIGIDTRMELTNDCSKR